MKIKTISIVQVEYVAYWLAKEKMMWNEPIPDFSSRFPHTLESCLIVPFQTFGGKPLYKGFIGKASVLFYLMIKNHPFKNGNKRIAMMVLFYFLYKNKKWLKVDEIELYNFAKWIAESNPKLKKETIKASERFIKIHIINL